MTAELNGSAMLKEILETNSECKRLEKEALAFAREGYSYFHGLTTPVWHVPGIVSFEVRCSHMTIKYGPMDYTRSLFLPLLKKYDIRPPHNAKDGSTVYSDIGEEASYWAEMVKPDAQTKVLKKYYDYTLEALALLKERNAHIVSRYKKAQELSERFRTGELNKAIEGSFYGVYLKPRKPDICIQGINISIDSQEYAIDKDILDEFQCALAWLIKDCIFVNPEEEEDRKGEVTQ